MTITPTERKVLELAAGLPFVEPRTVAAMWSQNGRASGAARVGAGKILTALWTRDLLKIVDAGISGRGPRRMKYAITDEGRAAVENSKEP